MPPMTGRVVAGRYNLQHPIGRGAMGVVWRARDQLLDRDVAVKEVVLSALLGADERRNAYQRTLREARTAARLSHRGVVAVYDVAEEDGRPWIIMELVPSRSLDQVLATERRLAPLRTGRIGQQLLSALAAAHQAGVLHRDVKPSNVLIATDSSGGVWDERAVLTDFGIAQFEGDPRLTQTGMVMGSPGFTAPERIRGGNATPASDLWSLGATLYAAAEGRGPYEQRGGAITTMSAIINEDAPVAAHAGPLGPVIAALLRREPSARPSASAAARMFSQLLPQLTETAGRPREATQPATVRAMPLPLPALTATAATDGTTEASAQPAAEEPAREPEPSGEAAADAELEPAANVPTVAVKAAATEKTAVKAVVIESVAAEAEAAEVEAAKVPGDCVDTAASDEAGAAKAGAAKLAAVMVLEAAPGSGVPQTVIDRDQGRGGYRPTSLSAPAVNPAGGPRFTASQRKERAVPTFSASNQDHSGAAQPESPPACVTPQAAAAQHGPYPGTTASFAGSSVPYAGSSQAQADLAGQYPPGAGERTQRRGRPWRLIAAVVGAVVLAAAIGAGTAFTLGHHGTGAQGSGPGVSGSGTADDPLTRYASVNALNHPSAIVPAGLASVQVTAADAGSYAGFTIDVPPSWKEHRDGFATVFTSPDGMVLDIDLTPHKYTNMVTEASYIARRAAPNFTGYRLLHLQSVPVRSTAGAIWQFKRVSVNGVMLTADDIVFIERTPPGSQSYAVYIWAPSSGWGSKFLPAFDKILPTFQTLPASS